jgi:hypothetical protein
MKKNTIERFIRDYREELDAFEPPRDGWAKLEALLPTDTAPPTVRVVPLWRRPLWRAAASILLIFSLGLLGYRYLSTPTSTDPALARIDPESARAAVQYASLIETKRGELRQLEQDNPALYREFSTEIEQLDGDYQKLRAELPQTPNQEELVQAMIQNLEMQINILNRQLRVIQKVKQAQKSHENDPVV